MVVQRNRLPNPAHPRGYTPAQIEAIFEPRHLREPTIFQPKKMDQPFR